MSSQSGASRIGTEIDAAAEAIRNGGIVVIPTETAYGLAVDPDNIDAVNRLFHLKQRDRQKPMLLLIADLTQLADLVDEVPQQYEQLIRTYWPGPLTLIFQSSKYHDNPVSGGQGTIGLRISPHPLVRELLQKVGKPITATSANHSGEEVIRTAQQAAKIFGENVDYILDGGSCDGTSFSTVVGILDGNITEFRAGKIKLPTVSTIS